MGARNKLWILFFLLWFCQGKPGFSQQVYVSDGQGFLIRQDVQNCHIDTVGGFGVFWDIAIYENHIYGITDSLYRIDLNTGTKETIGLVRDRYNNWKSGVGLVALDQDFLIADFYDSLSLISTQTGIATVIGKTGYYCMGDFAFVYDTLYMVSSSAHLIRIILNESRNAVLTVTDVGLLVPTYPSDIYGMFTIEDRCPSLYVTAGYFTYSVNTKTAELSMVCTDTLFVSNGAASRSSTKRPATTEVNIFTPNNDGVNDYFQVMDGKTSMKIYNRWGNLVFDKSGDGVKWNGENASQGTYYYIVSGINECYDNITVSGYVHLAR